jgi:hypothetical protein
MNRHLRFSKLFAAAVLSTSIVSSSFAFVGTDGVWREGPGYVYAPPTIVDVHDVSEDSVQIDTARIHHNQVALDNNLTFTTDCGGYSLMAGNIDCNQVNQQNIYAPVQAPQPVAVATPAVVVEEKKEGGFWRSVVNFFTYGYPAQLYGAIFGIPQAVGIDGTVAYFGGSFFHGGDLTIIQPDGTATGCGINFWGTFKNCG